MTNFNNHQRVLVVVHTVVTVLSKGSGESIRSIKVIRCALDFFNAYRYHESCNKLVPPPGWRMI